MAPRVASINHTRATECLLLELLMNMPHLLLQDSEDLHFMVVMVL